LFGAAAGAWRGAHRGVRSSSFWRKPALLAGALLRDVDFLAWRRTPLFLALIFAPREKRPLAELLRFFIFMGSSRV